MSKDSILRSENGTRYSMDNLSTSKWLNGQATGAEKAVVWLRQQAVEKFNAGKDADAVLLRSTADKMAKELVPALTGDARQFENDHPCIVSGDE